MNRYSCFLVLLFFTAVTAANMSDAYDSDLQYLPSDITYDPDIPLPESVLGAPVGEWHVRHDQLLQYLQLLADESPRIKLVEIGRTHENRPLIHLHISTSENLQNLESIRTTHLKNWRAYEGKQAPDISGYPLVLWMGYSIHGDESSGANASLLLAYYLAAAQGEEIDKLLETSVIILDPVLNPDGLARFAQWANSHKSKNLVADPFNREHQQDWPTGRTNHYWFDLNRDWLLLTHPESKARIAQFHRWRPHVLTDFHEMGGNSTYFFQPGIPSRTNPHTPDENVALTNELAHFHAKTLDSDKRQYFTKESFDDFYYGKGSTYPDAHGSIGILFEQASSRGHLTETENGMLSFYQTIQNQFNLSLSTFEGALDKKNALLDFQSEFARKTANAAAKDDVAGFIVTPDPDDRSRFDAFLNTMQQHQVQVSPLTKEFKFDDNRFVPGKSYFISLRQPQYRLIKSLFSTQKSFRDNTFYDVSNWNIALAFNLDFTAIPGSRWKKVPAAQRAPTILQVQSPKVVDSIVAWGFNWADSKAPSLLQYLLSAGFHVKQSEKSFNAVTTDGEVAFLAGAVTVPLGNEQPVDAHLKIIAKAASLNIKLHGIVSGLTPQGVDLGSRHQRVVQKPEILLLGGKPISQYEAGEVWHFLDTQLGVAPSIVELSRMDKLDLRRYSHIIAVDGNYKTVSASVKAKLEAWIKSGGVLIAQKRGAQWASEQDWLKARFRDKDDINDAFDTSTLNFAAQEALAGKKRVAGAVFQTQVDLTHPLMFGYKNDTLPVFRNSTLVMRQPVKPFIMAAQYSDTPLLAGYAAEEVNGLLAGSAMAVAHKLGNGRVIAFADNVNFRGYWRGTRRLMSNAIYLAQFINVKG